MASAGGTRRRTGCVECRRRKQQCDETMPSCLSCSRRQVKCSYPNLNLVTPSRFVVKVAGDHQLLPMNQRDSSIPFISIGSEELRLLCSQIAPAGPSKQDGSLFLRPSVAPSLTPMWTGAPSVCDAGTENMLIQYYLEVIGNSRVYIPTTTNLFLDAALPILMQGQGSVRSMILAMSAVEWSKSYPDDCRNYGALADCYKVKALQLLSNSLQFEDRAEENLLTCILLASMDISQGSQPSWLQHIKGAVALLHSLGSKVSATSTAFALRYAQYRYILMSTTRCQRLYSSDDQMSEESSTGRDEVLIKLAAVKMATGKYNRELVDPQLGLSIEMLDYICQISILEGELTSNDSNFSAVDQKRVAGLDLEQRIKDLPVEVSDDVDGYLRNSAECFRDAALIYLNLVIFHISAGHPKVQSLQESLLDRLCIVINQKWSRRSFPMWPLFIAGCSSLTDPQRKTVLNLFEVLESKWPVGNMYTVKRTLLAIWQTRDLHADIPGPTQPDDWQSIIERFGWKLSLS